MIKRRTQDEIKIILDLHAKWLKGENSGIRANLSEVNLSEANLSRVNLSGASLYRADLSRANLSDADLSRTNLSYTCIPSLVLEKHTAFAFKLKDDIVIKIGCEQHTYKEWLKIYSYLGKKNDYSKAQQKHYLAGIKLLASVIKSQK